MIQLLNIEQFVKNLKPVTSTEYITHSGEFNSEGLFSEQIFGLIDSLERKKTFSYIDLHVKVVHPTMLRIFKQLDRGVENFISTEESFTLDVNKRLQIDENGVTGISEFVKMFPKIKFRGETPAREGLIAAVSKAYKDKTLFIDKLLVIPPDQRPAFRDEKSGEWMIDPLNDYYLNVLRKALQLRTSVRLGPLFDLLNYELQRAVNNHDDFIRTQIEKKSGLIRSQLLGKRTDFSGRAVITPSPDLKVGEIGIPLRLAVSLFEPFIIHRLLYSGQVDKANLEEEIKTFTDLELSVDSVKKVMKSIKVGDEIPKSLFTIFFEATEVVMMNRIVLAKRDPVLHAESVRAYNPKLVTGNTIQLCTLQTAGHNADFDGDSSIISITYRINNKINTCLISDLIRKEQFKRNKTKTKNNRTKITDYTPVENLYIKSINILDGIIDYKKVRNFSVHKNIEMFKVHDTKSRFDDFWSSYDHSLIIYDEDKEEIRRISPKELIKEPYGKYLLKKGVTIDEIKSIVTTKLKEGKHLSKISPHLMKGEVKKQVVNYTSFLTNECRIKGIRDVDRLWCTLNNINFPDKVPVCNYCKKNRCRFMKDGKLGFSKVCSCECGIKLRHTKKSDPETLKKAAIKRKETFRKKYGVDHVSQLDLVKEKKKETALKNYGSLKSAYYDTAKKTIQEKYSTDNVSKLDWIKEKKIKTCIENRNTKFPLQCREVKNKSERTNLRKYKVKNFSQSNKARKRMKDGGGAYANLFIRNPSKPQVGLFHLVQRLCPYVVLNYPCNGYSIDIAIPKLNLAIEYDGTYWHENKEYDRQRQKQLEEEGWIFLKYVDVVPTIERLWSDIKRVVQ